MNAPPEPKTSRIALFALLGVVLFLEDVLLWILGDSRERLVHGIEGGVLVAIAIGTLFVREPSVRKISGWLALGWLGIAALRFAEAFGIPKSELRLPFFIGFVLVGLSALGYRLVAQRRGSNRPSSRA